MPRLLSPEVERMFMMFQNIKIKMTMIIILLRLLSPEVERMRMRHKSSGAL